jgi:PucR family transcriptional regulator, purine catabolism regulatory protein
MAITVGELAGMPSLRTRFLAGDGGADRTVTWAHVCELAAPWEWLGDGDLVMTTGLGIPTEPRAQEEYVVRLAEAGVVGVAIGENMSAPALTPRALRVADAHRFPLLMTRYEVPFSAMARTVVASNGTEEQGRFAHALRIFEHLSLLVHEQGEAEMLDRLGEEVDCRLYLIDARTGRSTGTLAEPLPDAVRSELLSQPVDPRRCRPAVLRLPESRGALVLPVPGPRELVLIAIPAPDTRPDLTLLHHVTTVLSLEQITVVADRERHRRLGSSLLAQIIDGRLEPALANAQLTAAGMDGPWVMTASRSTSEAAEFGAPHHALADQGIVHLLLTRGRVTYALLPQQDLAVERLVESLDDNTHTGISGPVGEVTEVPEASRQAAWSLHQAEAADERVAVYAEGHGISPFLPPSLEQGREAALRVLGPLLAYDQEHQSTLVQSLQVFLEENRSWQRAAPRLHVHKQSLVYRMNRVEQLTGRSLTSTADVSELWLALQAGKASGVIPA